jgi:hypothetical protein
MMWEQLLKIYDESRLNPGRPECMFAETLIFNEGWLLRSVLKEWKTGSTSSRLPFLPFPSDAKVYSEGQLRTPFKARFLGDPLAESHTRVDGIAGHFSLAARTKSGIALDPGCGYITAFEAKLYSPIGKGVKAAPNYDQVSRTAACLIHALLEARSGEGLRAHVVVLYPEDDLAIKPEELEKVQIRERIGERLAGYRATGDPTPEILRFAAGWEEMLEQLRVHFNTWEEVLADIGDEGLDRFYELCQQFGR